MNISIVIPAYNRAELLRKTLNSIENQTSSNWECLVVDDFSNDNTKEVVYEFNKRNERIKYYLNEHKKGAQGARNTGLDYAKYEWVIFFDSDNIMHDDFVSTMCSLQKKNCDWDVIACCSDIIDVEKGNTGKVMNPRCIGNIHDKLFTSESYVDFNQAIIRKSKLFEIAGLDEDCPSMQEWDTHIRLSRICTYNMINESHIDYYKGGKDAISSNSKREVVGRLYILKKHLDEWNAIPNALPKYSYYIYRLILKNSDKSFRREKIKELKTLVPFFYFRMLCLIVQKLVKKILK